MPGASAFDPAGLILDTLRDELTVLCHRLCADRLHPGAWREQASAALRQGAAAVRTAAAAPGPPGDPAYRALADQLGRAAYFAEHMNAIVQFGSDAQVAALPAQLLPAWPPPPPAVAPPPPPKAAVPPPPRPAFPPGIAPPARYRGLWTAGEDYQPGDAVLDAHGVLWQARLPRPTGRPVPDQPVTWDMRLVPGDGGATLACGYGPPPAQWTRAAPAGCGYTDLADGHLYQPTAGAA